ncbi:MAG: hypothetical protein AAFX08_02540 [Pseudomonadota bacterium]
MPMCTDNYRPTTSIKAITALGAALLLGACGAGETPAAKGPDAVKASQTEEVANTPADAAARQGLRFEISLDGLEEGETADGRIIIVLATDDETEPRYQTTYRFDGPQIFGMDVEGASRTTAIPLDATNTDEIDGFPKERLSDVSSGEYVVQAVFNRYDDFTLQTGQTVSLPASWAAGQNWRREPGNLFSTPMKVVIGDAPIALSLDQINPAVERPADTKYIKHVEIVSERLSKFWGREMTLGANILLPEGFDEHPDARYPLMIFHGHFPATFGGFRLAPPDPDLECEYSARFDLPCYNRTVQEEAHAFYQKWISPDFPRFIIIEIQHANPYYDDSYAVNSANLGPYGDAITYDLIPFVEEAFRGLGEPWARFMYGGSTGGWEAMAAQVFYPDEYNGAYIACPDPIDFRDYVGVNIYEDDNAYYRYGPFGRIARPGHRNYLGRVNATVEMFGRYELALGRKHRSGDQFDIWEAVYSPMGADGYPKRLWDKRTGEIDREVAAYWRENYDLRHILERDWSTLGPKLHGKLNIYTGDMDNYYLNNAVYLAEDFLTRADPPYGGEIDYGDRAEHCWNGDHENPNAISRLRYNTFYLPKIMKRIEETAPEGADLTSWRY